MMKRTGKGLLIVLLASAAMCCSTAIFCLSGTQAEENAASPFVMEAGVSVKIDGEEIGIGFTAAMSSVDLNRLQEEYASVSFGMLVAPLDYMEEYGDLNIENAFGENAVYDWAVQTPEGEWEYGGTKTRIFNLPAVQSESGEGGETYCELKSALFDISEEELTTNFIGRAYAKVTDENNVSAYLMADYAEGNGVNNAGSVVCAADRAISEPDPNVSDEDKTRLMENCIRKAAEIKISAFLAPAVTAGNIFALDKAYEEVYGLLSSLSAEVYKATVTDEKADEINARLGAMYELKEEIADGTGFVETDIINFAGGTAGTEGAMGLLCENTWNNDERKDVCPTSGTQGYGEGGAQINSQTSSWITNENANAFRITLPKIDFTKHNRISFTVKTNNAPYIWLDATYANKVAFGANEVVFSYVCNGTSLSETMSVNGAAYTREITDAAVIGGTKGDTFYVYGVLYSMTFISPISELKEVVPALYNELEKPSETACSFRYLVLGSATEYSVIYRAGSSSRAFAAAELASRLGEAAGTEFYAAATDDAAVGGNLQYILLSPSISDKNYSLSSENLTKSTGFGIKKFGSDVVVYSPTEEGLLNGVYGFLSDTVGLEFFTNDCCAIEKKKTLSLACVQERVFNPDFEYSVVGWDEPFNNGDYAANMGQVLDYKLVTGAAPGASTWHNFTEIVSKAEYGAEHPGWFSNGQLNLSYNDYEMVPFVVEKMKAKILSAADVKYFSFTQADTNSWSDGSTSEALYAQYGCHSAEYILFMNKCAERIDAWLHATDPGREVQLLMFAYQQTLDAPAVYDELTESYVPKSDSVRLYAGNNASVGVIVAPIFSEWYTALETQAQNALIEIETGKRLDCTVKEVFDKWDALTDNMHFWFYSAYYDNYLVPLDSVSALQQNYRFAQTYGDGFMLYQGQRNNNVSSDWSRLKIYLQSNLAKDVNFDVEAGTERFMEAYFGAAATAMKNLFAAEQAWGAELYKRCPESVGAVIGATNLSQKQYWDEGEEKKILGFIGTGKYEYDSSMLRGWMNYIESAYAAIASLAENDPTTYAKLHDRIELESLTIRYLLLKVYGDTAYDDSLEALYAACQRLGMTRIAETVTFD